VYSGASFHLVDPRTLTKKERETIEDIDDPIPIETANGEVVVNKRCRVVVAELGLRVWAYLHEDTVCVLSLGLLVDRAGFTFEWKPGKAPELIFGKKLRVPCHPHFNVPFIYASKARGNPFAEIITPAPTKPTIHPGKTSEPREGGGTFDKLMHEEMKGLEDLIPKDSSASSSSDDAGASAEEEVEARGNPTRPTRPGRSCG